MYYWYIQIGGLRWKLLKKQSETTIFSRFSTTSNSVFDLGSSSSTAVNSISLFNHTRICSHPRGWITCHADLKVIFQIVWNDESFFNGQTNTKPIHAIFTTFLTRIQYYGLVCSLNDWKEGLGSRTNLNQADAHCLVTCIVHLGYVVNVTGRC